MSSNRWLSRASRAGWRLRLLTLIALGLSIVSTNCAHQTKQISRVEWRRDDHFSRADRRQILEAATAAGFSEIRRVSKQWHRPSRQYHALVESDQTVMDRRVTWMALVVCNDVDRYHCDRERGARPWLRSGNWMTSSSIFREERWRVVDGDWHKDVELGSDVMGPIADAIIVAIRRQLLVNKTRQPDVLVQIELRNTDWLEVRILRKPGDDQRYEVVTDNDGGGQHLEIRLVDDQVELESLSHWIA